MTNPHDDDFDWDAAEADVYDLDAARQRRSGPNSPVDATDDNLTTDAFSHYSGYDDTIGGNTPVFVDSVAAQRRPRFTLAGIRDSQLRPITPQWLRSRTEFISNLAYAIRLGGHSIGYHALRLPKYAGKLIWRSPRGLGRVVRAYIRWLWDLEGEPVRQSIVRASVTRPEEAKTYERLTAKRDRRVRWRGIISVILLVAAVVAVVFSCSQLPGCSVRSLSC